MRKIEDALHDLNEYSRKADEAFRALPAPDPACHVCVTDLRLSVIEEFLACMFPEWTVDGWNKKQIQQTFIEQEKYRQRIVEYNARFPDFSHKVPKSHNA